MGACFGKKALDCEAPIVVASCHPAYRFGAGTLLRLFGRELCPLTASVRMALQHKGVGVDAIWVPPEGGVSSAKLEWLATELPQESCSFPILQHGNSVVHGCAADIINYVEVTFPDPPLWAPPPESGASSMDARDWVAYVVDTVTPLLWRALYEGDQQAEEEVEAVYARLDRGMWEHSKGGPYFFGRACTMVDIYLVPLLELSRSLAYFRGIEVRAVHSQLLAYTRRMLHFPAYAAVRMDPDLLDMSVSKAIEERAPPAVSTLVLLQHRSMGTHLGALVDESAALASSKVDASTSSPVKAGLSLKLKKLCKQYTSLLGVMQEHAQMEERVIFPLLDDADKGLSAGALNDHARDLPIMNGIREDMKSVTSLQQGSRVHEEALLALATRLKVFQDCTRDHFAEEENEILPMLEAMGIGHKQQDAAVESLVSIMEQSHGQLLLPYMLQGLRSHEVYHYVSTVHRAAPVCARSMLDSLHCAAAGGDEFATAACKLLQQRLPALGAASTGQGH